MKPWNKPIRFHYASNVKKYDKQNITHNKNYGVTNWMVGTCTYPWSPWVQIHIGYFSVQIKWYLITVIFSVICFMTGVLIGN